MLMRILMMADVPPNPDSGAGGTEFQTSVALRRMGHDVHNLWNHDLGPRKISHGNLHYLVELPRSYRTALRSALRREMYDVIHVNQPHGYLAAEWLSRHHPDIPFVHRSHGLELRAEKELAKWERYGSDRRPWPRRLASHTMAALLAKHTFRLARASWGHIVYVNEDRDFLVSNLAVSPERVAVIAAAPPPSTIDIPPLPMSNERLQTIVYVSQFAFFKAPMITAAAMNALAVTHHDLRFIWVCDRAHHDQVRGLLSSQVNTRLELMPWMTQDALRDIYDQGGIFLFPSFFEGFGKVFLEAMARGNIVIATNIAGPRDVIEHGQDGFLVPTGDVPAIVAAAELVLGDFTRASTISSRAAEKARRFTWARVAQESVAFYERLRALGPPSPLFDR